MQGAEAGVPRIGALAGRLEQDNNTRLREPPNLLAIARPCCGRANHRQGPRRGALPADGFKHDCRLREFANAQQDAGARKTLQPHGGAAGRVRRRSSAGQRTLCARAGNLGSDLDMPLGRFFVVADAPHRFGGLMSHGGAPLGRGGEAPAQGLGQPLHHARDTRIGRKPARLPVINQFDHSPEAGGDDGQARTHGLHADIGEILPARRHDGAVGPGEKPRQFAACNRAMESKTRPQAAGQPTEEQPP